MAVCSASGHQSLPSSLKTRKGYPIGRFGKCSPVPANGSSPPASEPSSCLRPSLSLYETDDEGPDGACDAALVSLSNRVLSCNELSPTRIRCFLSELDSSSDGDYHSRYVSKIISRVLRLDPTDSIQFYSCLSVLSRLGLGLGLEQRYDNERPQATARMENQTRLHLHLPISRSWAYHPEVQNSRRSPAQIHSCEPVPSRASSSLP